MASPVQVTVQKSIADAAELSTWLDNLDTDYTAGKIVGFNITLQEGILTGYVNIPCPQDLSVAIEDSP